MVAGLVLVGSLFRFSTPQDDSVGGAVPTGTPIYTNLQLRMKSLKPTQALQEQGLETPTLYSISIFPSHINIEHNDIIQVTAPVQSKNYNKTYRVIGIQEPSVGAVDYKLPLIVTARRYEKARKIQ